MAEQVFLTESGYKALEKKLKNLKEVKRMEVAEKIKIAREFGDISENAEYDAAKEEQAQIEGEILEIEKKIRKATIIDNENEDKTVVGMGSKVKIFNETAKKEVEYTVVGTMEADPMNRKISNESPIGMALIGGRIGEIVDANTPSGIVRLQIRSIE